MSDLSMAGGWNRHCRRPAAMAVVGLVLAGSFLAAAQAVAAVLALVVSLVLSLGVALSVFGNRVDATEREIVFRAGFLRYTFPWADVRGFILDVRSPSDVYIAALHPATRSLDLFEVPAVECSSALQLAATLNAEFKRRQPS